MVALRVVCFDHVFFDTQSLPNHDMYQAAPFFTTSMHSVRLSGDIAWWNPTSINGYAQYYQSFLSPLAPTPNHIVFIAWSHFISLLSFTGLAIPEYFQYLIISYAVFPFLTFLAFAAFATEVFPHRATAFLVLVVYAFSGIGLWNSAWFFFQEPFSLFFLLATAVAALRKPTVTRMLLLLAAILVQVTSFNYWTLYNSWFVLILLGTYCAIHPNQARRLAARARAAVKRHKAGAVIIIALSVIVVALWAVIIGSIVLEQNANYIRSAGSAGTYSMEAAYQRVQETRRFTTELFNPYVGRAVESYNLINDMHNARYIGVCLLPLLALFVSTRWRRRERWLLSCTVCVLVVCLAPPFLLSAWAWTPFMNRILHHFYFYTHYWQLMVVLLAGAGMEAVFRTRYNIMAGRRLLAVISGFILVLTLVFIGYSAFSDRFSTNDQNLQANLHSALLALLTSVAILRALLSPTVKSYRLFVFVILALTLADLTRYFRDVNRLDQTFTQSRWAVKTPLPPGTQARLNQIWADPDLGRGFKAGLFDNMPVGNWFWPQNTYIEHRAVIQLREMSADAQSRATGSRPLEFYNTPEAVPQLDQKVPADAGFSYVWDEWRYNAFAFTAYAPADGWLFISQLYDPLWRLTVDGRPVQASQSNLVGMAIPIKTGEHRVRMDYRPLARGLYLIASLLLEAALLVLVVFSLRASRGRVLRRPA